MKTYRLIRRQVLEADILAAWQFFSDPSNLRLITPPWLDFRITSPVSESVYAGLIITYRIRPLAGIAVPWVSEITHGDAPLFLVVEQRLGPYGFWHHQPRLLSVSKGVEKTDVVHYRVPGGLLGIFFHAVLIRRKLDEIFDYRKTALKKIFPPAT